MLNKIINNYLVTILYTRKMIKGEISNFIRKLNLIDSADSIRYLIQKSKNKKENNKFLNNNPELYLFTVLDFYFS